MLPTGLRVESAMDDCSAKSEVGGDALLQSEISLPFAFHFSFKQLKK